jgi:tripartite-type tricarboxylate transporter receptor subunit TctC
VVSRIVGEHMSRTLGQQIIIENMLGAGGTTASTRAARAAPDGYTIEMGHMGTHAASVALYPNLAYKPDVDFEPIGLVAGTPILILAKKDFPAKDLKEFVAYVKANVDKLNMAHAGVGSVSFTSCLLLNHILQVKPTSVPYQGTGPAMNALVARAGRLYVRPDRQCRATSPGRHHPVLWRCHRGAQSGAARRADDQGGRASRVPGFRVERTVRPQRHAQADRRQARRRAQQGARRRQTRKRLLELGSDIPGPQGRGPAALAALVKSEIARWTPIIKAAGPSN